MGTFGESGADRDADWTFDDVIGGCVYTCPEVCTADSITAQLWTNVNRNVKCALYKDSDDSRVGVTEQRVINTGGAWSWETFNFTAPKPTLANVGYLLVAWGDGAGSIGIKWTGAHDHEGEAEVYDGFPDPIVPGVLRAAHKSYIYCTYSVPTGAPQGSIVPKMMELLMTHDD